MDTHDHKKTHPSGHEHHAVHLCHKCGWPFPNPHPSAKHRRAHKRVCGTLEGYKLVDPEEKPHLNPSDDEHDHSDEDHKTSDNPSPNVLERSEKDQGSGGSGTRSNQSEDEVFADASASFSENAGEVSSGVERVLKGDLNLVQIIEAGSTDKTIQQISHTSDSGTEEHHDGEKTTTDGLVDRPGSVDCMDHESNSTSTLMEAHEPPALLNVYGDMSSHSVIVKSESQLDHKPKPSVDESAEVAILADPLLENVQHEADVVANEESNRDGDISGSVVLQREDSRNTNELEKLDETEKLHANSVTLDEVLSNKGLGGMLVPEKLTEDFSSGSVSLGQMSLTAESAQIKVDSMQQLESANSANFVDASDAQPQENENFRVYSVPHDLPVIEQPEDLIRGFKDHKGMKIHQDDNLVQLDTRVLQDSLDASTNEDDSNVESKIIKEGSQMSLESPLLPDASEWKGENDKPVDKEGALEGEKFSAQLSAACDVDQIKPDASTNEDCSNVESKARKEGSQMSLESPVLPDASEWKGENDKPVDKEGALEGEQFSAQLSAASDVDQIKPDASTNEDCSNVESKARKEGSQMSLESPLLPDASEWKGENDKPVDKEGALEGEKFSAQLSAANDVDQIKPDASTFEDDSNVESKARKEGSQMSLESPLLPDASEWKRENDKPVDKEGALEGEKSSAQLSAASDVDQIKPDSSTNEDCSNVVSKTRKEGSQMSLESPVLPDASEWKGENDKPVDKEGALEGEKFSAQLSAANDVDQIKPDASTIEDCSNVESKARKEGSQMSLESPLLPNASEWKGENNKPVDKKGALEGEKFSAQLSAASDVDQIKPDASTIEDCSNVESKARKEGSQMSLESPLLPNASEWKGENNKPVDKKGALEGEKFSAQLSAASDVDQLKPDAIEGLEDEKAEGNKIFHVLPIPHDLPLVKQPENAIEDFKDHTGMKMDQFDNLGSCETTVQEGNVVSSLDYSSSQSKTEKEDAKASADVLEITAKVEEQMLKPLDEEILIEREKISGDKDPELKLDPSAGWNLPNPIGSVNDSNENEEKNKNSHVHSVPDDVVVVENMIEDFKDRKENVYQLDDVASSRTVSHRENSDIPVFEDHSISELKTEVECTELFPSGMHDKQRTSGSEDEGCKTINSEVPVGGKALPHSLQSVDEILEDKGEVFQESSTEEVEKKNVVETHGMEELKYINTSSLIVETPESASKILADVNPAVIDTLTEAHGTISDNIGINEKAKTDTYDNNAGDHSRSAVEESSLASGTATKSAENLNDEQVNMTNKSIADESMCGSEERTGTKTESKGDNLLKEETVLKVEASTHEAEEVRVISFDNSSAHPGSQDGDLASEEGIKEDERDRSDRGEKPCIFGGVAVAETNASATEELHVNAIELGGSPTEHPITLPEENNTAMQQHPKSADIASNDDDSSKMVSENGAPKLTRPIPDTMPPTPSNIAAEDQAGNGTSRIVPGPDSLMQEESDAAVKQGNGESVLGASLDSSGSLEGHWGSVSVLSTQSDTPAVGEAEALPSNDSRAGLEPGKSHTNSGKAEPKVKHTDKSDVFEPPSFMTLVEPRGSNDQDAAAAVPNREQLKSPSVQAGWIPSLPHVANDSQGRKRNEEIIAKVTNWSTGKQHSPLKNLLVEANRDNKLNPTSPRENSASATRKEENVVKDDGSGMTTVGSILSSDAPDSGAAKKQVGQEWNSPARYPEDMKREKRKVKGRPYWVQFVCCTSAN